MKCDGIVTTFFRTGESRIGCLFSYTPEVEGRNPVIKEARDGLHTGAAQYALVNSMPLAASRSMFGVLTSGCPPRQPIQSFRSSTAMKRTFGFDEVAAGNAAAVASVVRKALREKALMTRQYHERLPNSGLTWTC